MHAHRLRLIAPRVLAGVLRISSFYWMQYPSYYDHIYLRISSRSATFFTSQAHFAHHLTYKFTSEMLTRVAR